MRCVNLQGTSLFIQKFRFNYNLMLKVCFREYFSSIIAIFKEVN